MEFQIAARATTTSRYRYGTSGCPVNSCVPYVVGFAVGTPVLVILCILWSYYRRRKIQAQLLASYSDTAVAYQMQSGVGYENNGPSSQGSSLRPAFYPPAQNTDVPPMNYNYSPQGAAPQQATNISVPKPVIETSDLSSQYQQSSHPITVAESSDLSSHYQRQFVTPDNFK